MGTSRIPKLFCHLAMMDADAALRFAVALTGPASPDLLGLAEPPAVHVWARGAAEAASYTGPVLFEPLEAHVSSVAAEAQRALHRAREWREAAMVTVGLTLLGLVVVATIYFGWVSVRASVIGVGAASYLLAEATPTAIATVAGLAVLSFAGVLLRQHMRAGPTDAVQARSALERALAAAEQGRFETGWWYRQRRAAAQAEVEECAVRYAAALVACPGELPPKGTYTAAASLFAALRPKTEGALVPVRLLRSSWIKARAARLRAATSEEERRRLALPRRQALERDEPSAFLSVDEMEALPRHDEVLGGQLALGASSYCWLTGAAGGARTHAADAWEAHRHPPSLVAAAHPDPLGEQLVSLAAAIERAEAEEGGGFHDGFPSEAGFFIDFASIHQKDAAGERTPEERAAFAEALSTMQLWYAHTKTTAFLTRALPDGYDGLPGYAERGWTTCESSWAALAKESTAACWAPIWDVAGGAAYRRRPPMAPAAMARLVASRRFTSKKGDLPLVIELNTRMILSRSSAMWSEWNTRSSGGATRKWRSCARCCRCARR